MGELFREHGWAEFSADHKHRFQLWRYWGPGAICMFIGLNPSTADSSNDDPTVRRCIGYAKAWGYDRLCMANIFSFRATDPNRMFVCPEPSRPENDARLAEMARNASLVVAAWGAHGNHNFRAGEVMGMFDRLSIPVYCLGKTKFGLPRHPLYLRKDLTPVPFSDAADKQVQCGAFKLGVAA